MRGIWVVGALLGMAMGVARGADWPTATEGDFVMRDFRFQSDDVMPEVKIHYRTIGTPTKDAAGRVNNAVLVLHGTTGSGAGFLVNAFAGELFGKGQLLDGEKYFLILPDAIGHGKSSKPSDGMHAKFPRYGYHDMIEAQHRLLTEELKVDHLRLVMGTSMGGMHTWLWGEMYPGMMDALMPLASLPEQISGRNRMWRKIISQTIRQDPEWNGGEYEKQPHGLAMASEITSLMTSNPKRRYEEAPTEQKADEVILGIGADAMKGRDANDYVYAWESSWDYDPGPGLEKIEAPLVAINFADDLINPPDQGILERQIKRVKRGRAVVIPESAETRGHTTHSLPALWKDHLAELLQEIEQK